MQRETCCWGGSCKVWGKEVRWAQKASWSHCWITDCVVWWGEGGWGRHWEAEDDTGRLNELIALAEAGLQAEEDDDAFFTQVAEAVDEAEAAYDRWHGGQSNAGEPSHINEEENTFLSQAADEAEAAYYRRKADQGNAGEPSHSNKVVVEDWYSDDELLTQYVSDWEFFIASSLVPCFINDQCSYVVEILLCCLIFHLNY